MSARVNVRLLDRNPLDYFIFKLFIILLEKHFKMFTYNLNTKTHFFLQNFFRMLYVVMSYTSMTSDYCFHTSNPHRNNKHYLKIKNISAPQITKGSIQVILKCKNTLLSTKLFQNVICNDMLQINDLRLLFSYFKYSQKQ